MRLVCQSYEETIFEVRILSETATKEPRRKNIYLPYKPFEAKAAPAPVGPKPDWLMDKRPEHNSTRKWK